MNRIPRYALAITAALSMWAASCASPPAAETTNPAPPAPPAPPRPNIMLMMVDDMGIGDTSAYLERRLAPIAAPVPLTQNTPQLERLANMGVLFTDVHTPSSMCSSTRYALLTGRLAHRPYLKQQGWLPHGPNPPMLSPGLPTLGTLMQRAGYRTACIGKYHVGVDFDNGQGEPATDFYFHDVDFTRPLLNGPAHHGFDRFFGVPGNLEDSLDSEPRVFIQDERWTLTDRQSFRRIGMGRHEGNILAAPDWDPTRVGPTYLEEILKTLDAYTRDGDKPFFIYFAPNANHQLIHPGGSYAPPERIAGQPVAGASRLTSGEGVEPRVAARGDMVLENDIVLGRLLDELQRREDPRRPGHRLIDNTLFIFTSDNGSNTGLRGEPSRESGGLRGRKTQLYEGGHRVPFLACWPGRLGDGRIDTPGGINRHFFALTDLFATFARLLDQPLEPNEAPDSYNVLDRWLHPNATPDQRPRIIHHHSGDKRFGRGALAIRQGPYKLMVHGSLPIPRATPDSEEALGGKVRPLALYHVDDDLIETTNLIADDKVPPRLRARVGELADTLLRLHNRGHLRLPTMPTWVEAGHPLILDDGEHHLRNDLTGIVGFVFRLAGDSPRRVTDLGLWDDQDQDRAVRRATVAGPGGEGSGLTRHDIDRATAPGQPGRGLQSRHVISLEQLDPATGQRRPVATVRASPSGPSRLDGEFRYFGLDAPVTLEPGQRYVLTMTTTADDGDLLHHHASITGRSPLVHPWIEIERAVFAPAAGADYSPRFPSAINADPDYDRYRLPVGPTLRFAAP